MDGCTECIRKRVHLLEGCDVPLRYGCTEYVGVTGHAFNTLPPPWSAMESRELSDTPRDHAFKTVKKIVIFYLFVIMRKVNSSLKILYIKLESMGGLTGLSLAEKSILESRSGNSY